MTAHRSRVAALRDPDIDPVDLASGFGVLAGLLSTVQPYFLGLAFALTGLLIALSLREAVRRTGSRAAGSRAGSWRALALGAPFLGWAVVLTLPPAWSTVRGALIAAGMVPVWWSSRRARQGA